MGCSSTITYNETIDTPLSISNENGTFYYHRDHQGSIVGLSNENGDMVESIKYDNGYGKILEHQRIVETNNLFCFTGREFDAEDLYYYRARYYDPTTKHFLTEDPIGFLSGDYNHYRYVSNDPANLNDPFGLCPPCVVGLWHLGRIAVTYGAKKLIQKQLARKLAKKLADEAKELAKEEAVTLGTITVTAVVGALVDKPDLDCGEVGRFKPLSNTTNAMDTENNGDMERDHIPQIKYMREKIQKTKAFKGIKKVRGKSKNKIENCVLNAVEDRAYVIGIPKDMHKAGRTGDGKGKGTWRGDMSSTPKQIADKDIAEYRRLLKGNNLTPKEKEVMDKVSDDCKTNIEKGLKKMENKKINNFFTEIINKCKQPPKKTTRRK